MHLGGVSRSDVLRSPAALRALLEAVASVDRLVLLGDVIELRQGPARDALGAAEPVLAQLGRALGDGGEVVIVPGNHDHQLIAGWARPRGRDGRPRPMGIAESVDWDSGEGTSGPLAALARALRPARVRASYPGVWLRSDVWATHGHYLDRHTTVPMVERLAAGAMARLVGSAGDPSRGAEGYEAVLAPIYAWIFELAQHGGPQLGRSSHGLSGRVWGALERSRGRGRLAGAALRIGFAALVAALGRTSLGPVRSDISSPELRRASLRAFGEVLAALDVRAQHVLFGHTHRAGPLPGDELGEWVAGGARLCNSGSWVHEPAYLGRRPSTSPYRAGFAVLVDEDGPPVLRNLLDGAPTATPG